MDDKELTKRLFGLVKDIGKLEARMDQDKARIAELEAELATANGLLDEVRVHNGYNRGGRGHSGWNSEWARRLDGILSGDTTEGGGVPRYDENPELALDPSENDNEK